MVRQDFKKTYTMISPNKRYMIIQKINNCEIESKTITGQKQKWWLKKHHPNNEIPRNIYLLGNGTIHQLYIKYINNYGEINEKLFINYTRELISQNIMV